MTNPSSSIATAKGALVASAADGSQKSISFQYNPDTLRRTIEPNTVGGKPGSRSRTVRFAGAPAETLTLDCRFSSVDQPGTPYGVAPQLAALALLAYPSTQAVAQAQALLDEGGIEVLAAPADPLLFVFGGVVMPCEVVSFSIVEELHDATLTPVLASVTLTLRALSYSDVDSTNPSYTRFMAYQSRLEWLAEQAYQAGGS